MTTSTYSERLTALRKELAQEKLDGFLVPKADEYGSEYVAAYADCVGFLTGFTGSAATVVVLKDKAAFITDGRYTLQASKQIPLDLFEIHDIAKKTPLAWLEENAGKGSSIGYDPWLHTADGVERLKKAVAKAGAACVSVERNPIGTLWTSRPAPPQAPVFPYEEAFAGKTSAEKRKDLAAELQKKNLAAVILTDTASIAWLLNVRGGDIVDTPVALSRAILKADGTVDWFIDPQKITPSIPPHLGDDVAILDPEKIEEALQRLARSGKSVLLDPSETPSWIADFILEAHGQIEKGPDPSALPRAIKNGVELSGIRAANIRDSAALTNFLAWLDGHWEKEKLTELTAARKLAQFRDGGIHYRGPSFETISATGEHGAIVHYQPTSETDAPLLSGQLYLLDSGGQYLDGTTDVTRTVVLGKPEEEMRTNYTRVLKGHIGLATVRFPEGTTGADLDVLARQHLWRAGLDYNHGTGHGVGCYLVGHEGPQGISKRNKVPLKPGMVLSDEPGYYKAGFYGIRIESLITVVEIEGLSSENKMLGFDMLTFVPLDRRLIDAAMLTDLELAWVNDYHERVQKKLRPMLDDAAGSWLDAATEEIVK